MRGSKGKRNRIKPPKGLKWTAKGDLVSTKKDPASLSPAQRKLCKKHGYAGYKVGRFLLGI